MIIPMVTTIYRTLHVLVFALALTGCALPLGGRLSATPPLAPSATPSLGDALGLTATPAPSRTVPPTPTPAPSRTALPTATPAPPTATFVPLEPTATLTPLGQAEREQIFSEVWERVRDSYLYADYNGANWEAVREEFAPQIAAAQAPEDFYNLMRELVNRLNDDHSRFETPQEVAAQEAEFEGDLRYGGIGAIIRTIDEGLLILELAPDGPAAQAGLQSRDLVLAVNGIPVDDAEAFGPEGPISVVRGEPGTPVRLTVQRGSEPAREVEVIRAAILEDVFNTVRSMRLAGEIGLVTLPSFYVDAVDAQVRDAVEGLLREGDLNGLIIDVRSNSGGFVHLMRNTVALFHSGGSIGSTSGRDQSDSEEQQIPEGQLINGIDDLPIAILISDETASAAEMFAAGMQVLGRATVVGVPSAGNTENLFSYRFDDGSRLLLAQVAYRLPDSTLIEGRGVIPDREVPVEWWRYKPADDPQVLAAIDELARR